MLFFQTRRNFVTASSAGFEHVTGTAEVKMTSGFSITLDQGLWVEAEDEFLAIFSVPSQPFVLEDHCLLLA